MKMTVEVGVLLVSLAVAVAEQPSCMGFSTIDDMMDGFLSISEAAEDSLFTVKIPRPIRKDVTFWCCNSNTKKIRKTGIKDPLLRRKLDVTLPVVFVIHGLKQGVQDKWPQDSVRELCQYRRTNACGVDWRRLAKMFYPKSAKNTIRVGKYVAAFVKFLLTKGVSMNNIILVGFSLGAHVAGIAGSTLGGRVPLIIGLDPAGPLKTCPILLPAAERLDPTDAKFVQAIYTCKGILSSTIPLGTQNFYPSGGIYPQPWCTTFPLTILSIPLSIACSHSVAPELFRRTINSQTVIEGTQCTGIMAYTLGKCRYWQKDRMGLDSRRIPGKFYLSFDTPELAKQDFVYPPKRR